MQAAHDLAPTPHAIESKPKAESDFRGVLRDPERGGGGATLIHLMQYAVVNHG
jgi:hypothetical protein